MSESSGFSGPWDAGWAGVDLFFVISGFVMVWVTQDRPASLSTTGRFLYHRVTRIYPLWWIFCSVMALYFWVSYGQPASPATQSAETAFGTFLKSLLLWPEDSLPVLTVGWTLIFEMAFYALFAVILLLPAKWRGLALSLWGLLLIARWVTMPATGALPDSWLGTILHPLCLEFLMGAASAYLIRSVPLSRFLALILTFVGIGAFLGALTLAPDFDSEQLNRLRVFAFGLPSALILIGWVGWERADSASLPKPLLAIGDASYTLYLSHFIVLLVLKRVCEGLGLFTSATPFSLIGFVAIGSVGCVIASLLLYRLLERPLLQLSRRVVGKVKT